jgi:rhomboid protease GluP
MVTITIVSGLILIFLLLNRSIHVATYSADLLGNEADLVMRGSVFRIFTALWLENFDIMALVTNVLLLLAVGWAIEVTIGHLRFLVIYIVSGIIGNLLTDGVLALIWKIGRNWRWIDASSYLAVGLGASTAIAGVSVAGVTVFRELGKLRKNRLRQAIIILAVVTLGGSIFSPVIRLTMPLDGSDLAHIMGGISGFILTRFHLGGD